eukprot:TRINITY_DN2701_c0_g1_i2.p1 TRINITY_DN2701_c0_g1~~TRINITY_DN2701_c0_g1_i2.p1  ORF type:complete len:325 (-),score=74.26 TRINITY_DN2701_c0_g1_i2:988-1962(-)
MDLFVNPYVQGTRFVAATWGVVSVLILLCQGFIFENEASYNSFIALIFFMVFSAFFLSLLRNHRRKLRNEKLVIVERQTLAFLKPVDVLDLFILASIKKFQGTGMLHFHLNDLNNHLRKRVRKEVLSASENVGYILKSGIDIVVSQLPQSLSLDDFEQVILSKQVNYRAIETSQNHAPTLKLLWSSSADPPRETYLQVSQFATTDNDLNNHLRKRVRKEVLSASENVGYILKSGIDIVVSQLPQSLSLDDFEQVILSKQVNYRAIETSQNHAPTLKLLWSSSADPPRETYLQVSQFATTETITLAAHEVSHPKQVQVTQNTFDF